MIASGPHVDHGPNAEYKSQIGIAHEKADRACPARATTANEEKRNHESLE